MKKLIKYFALKYESFAIRVTDSSLMCSCLFLAYIASKLSKRLLNDVYEVLELC